MSAFNNLVDVADVVGNDSEFGDDGDDEQVFTAFQHVGLTKGKLNLNIAPRYVRGWSAKHAFRELFQNFVDGIVESFSLKQPDLKFQYLKDDDKRRIEITVSHPNTSELCGYILFKWDEENMGSLEICNCKARLYDANFQMGGTNKTNKSHLAGQHGEGFKLGALVFRRQPCNYSVRLIASSSYINFNFNSRKTFVANITDISGGKVTKRSAYFAKKESDGRRRILEPKYWEDVCWEIGASRRSTNPDGSSENTAKIGLHDFEDWITATTLIIPPTEIVRTEWGNLLLDPTMEGKIFLRGLELPDRSVSGKKFQYGYDIAVGAIGRDRTSISNANEESLRLSRIWRDAIFHKATTGEEEQLLSKYLDLINQDRHADVHLAKKHIQRDMAQLMWTHLLKRAVSDEPHGFYFCSEFAKEDVPVITKHLRLKPMQLSRSMWELLHGHKFCRSAQEERQHRFQTLTPLIDPDLSSFGRSLSRLLKICLEADDRTKDRSFTIVDGGNLDIQTYYDASAKEWKVDKKLFDIQLAHESVYACEGLKESSQSPETNVFWCHHAVVKLYDLMLQDLENDALQKNTEVSAASCRLYLSSMVHILMLRVPQNVLVTATARGGELQVTWDSTESKLAAKNSSSEYMITLHCAELCSKNSSKGVYRSELSNVCACQTAKVHPHNESYIFTDLNTNASYFASIRYDEDVAIYADPSDVCSPRPMSAPIAINEGEDADDEDGGGSLFREPQSLSNLDGMDLDTEVTPRPTITQVNSLLPFSPLSVSKNSSGRSSLVSRALGPENYQENRSSSTRDDHSIPLGSPVNLNTINVGDLTSRDWYNGAGQGRPAGILIGIPKNAEAGNETPGPADAAGPSKRRRTVAE